MRRFITIVLLFRLANSAHPVLAIIVAYFASDSVNSTGLLQSVLLFVLLHSLVTLWNDIEDMDVDGENHRTPILDLKKQGHLRDLRIALLLLSISSFVFLIVAPLWVSLLSLTYITLGWAYNRKPLQLSRRPVGSMLVMWLAYGVIPFAIGASLGDFSWEVLVLGIGWSLSRVSLSLLKDFKDAPGDAKSNKKTFLLVYGASAVNKLSFSLAMIGLSLISAVITVRFTGESLVYIPVVLGAMWLIVERSKLFRDSTYRGFNQLFHEQLQYQLYFDGMVLVCLTI